MINNWKGNYMRYKDFFLNILQIYYAKPNIKIYLELSLSLLTIIVFAIFAIKPTILTIIELNKEIHAKTETIKTMDQKLIDLQTADKIMQNEVDKLTSLDVAVPNSAKTEDVILALEKLANENSLQIMNISMSDIQLIGDGKDKKNNNQDVGIFPADANELPFNTSMSGSYQNLMSMISDIENRIRPMKIDSLTITTKITEESKVLVLTITGRLPFVKKQIL